MRIALIGFMCSGKTTVGRVLAERAAIPFIDLDRRVEERIGPITKFFASEGEEAFREVEREVLIESMDRPGPLILATGGGTPFHADNLERLVAWGAVVFLDPSFEELMRRIERSGGDRPQLFGLTGEALRARVSALLAERAPGYARADHRVDASGGPDEVAACIMLLGIS
ncbi:MAG: AAA family ATPase [Flavobacteriales bacterium]|nr:AAA family ATPase [Flavobacteriales bacterium]